MLCFAVIPIALGLGAGSELRQPLGVTVRRRPARLAGADAVHHPGDLSLHRAAIRRRTPPAR